MNETLQKIIIGFVCLIVGGGLAFTGNYIYWSGLNKQQSDRLELVIGQLDRYGNAIKDCQTILDTSIGRQGTTQEVIRRIIDRENKLATILKSVGNVQPSVDSGGIGSSNSGNK